MLSWIHKDQLIVQDMPTYTHTYTHANSKGAIRMETLGGE